MRKITEREFKQLAKFIQENYGIHLKSEKKELLIGRLHHVLEQYGFRNFSEYYEYLIADQSGKAADVLVNKISTNHTFFNREPDHFHFFRDEVLPYLKETVKDRDLRIWSAGCSTGEEPYTLAMIIDEYFGKEKMSWDTKILATDISDRALQAARSGIYKKENVSRLPAVWVLNYFTRWGPEGYEVKDKIKNEVIFRRFNLMDRFPFRKKFHVIFCRNVMIYFDHETKTELIRKFYDSLAPGGYLFIGHSESLSGISSEFQYIKPSIYRK